MYQKLPKPFFVLAPMDDVTDTVFRQVIASTAAPDLFFTEFVNVDALQSAGRAATLPRLSYTKSEKPLIAQIWGKNPENYYKSAQDIVKMGFDGVDINMGCPVKDVVQNGCCSALMNNRELALEIIQATKEGARIPSHLKQGRDERRAVLAGASGSSLVVPVGTNEGVNEGPDRVDRGSESLLQVGGDTYSLPVSVKTRLGFNEIDYTWHELLLNQKLNALSIHGRTRKQMSKVPADWVAIGEIVKLKDKLSPTTQIIGNGDVQNHKHGLELAKKYNLDGIMIGRAVFHDPFVFAPNSPWESYTPGQKKALYAKHVKLFAQTWKNAEKPLVVLNKFCKIYISGFDGAKELRDELMHASSADELLQRLAD